MTVVLRQAGCGSAARNGAEQDAGIFAFSRTYDDHTVLVVRNASETKTSETNATTLGGVAMTTDFASGTVLAVLVPADHVQ